MVGWQEGIWPIKPLSNNSRGSVLEQVKEEGPRVARGNRLTHVHLGKQLVYGSNSSTTSSSFITGPPMHSVVGQTSNGRWRRLLSSSVTLAYAT